MPAALPDPRASCAVLAGVWAYPRMPEDRQLPAVRNNLERLAELLRDPRVWGLPAENCVVVPQPAAAETVIGALRAAKRRASDTLLFYYAGHGLTDPNLAGELYLALPDSYEPFGTHASLRYDHVRSEMRKPGTARKAVILDCCWSGLAEDDMGGAALAGIPAVPGAAVLTACAANRTAHAPPGERYTAFSGELVSLLDAGAPGEPALLDAGTVWADLADRLGRRGLPLPHLAARDAGTAMVLARNTAASADGEVGAAAAPATAPPGYPAVRAQLSALVRQGRYEEARVLRMWAARHGVPEAVRDVVRDLRRTGHYDTAARLERER